MTGAVLGLSVDAGVPPSLSRAQQTVVTNAAVRDAAAFTRPQLPTAVPPAALVAAYHANTSQPLKPTLRNPAPSSALAAQFIAQEAAQSAEIQDMFAPPPAANSRASDTVKAKDAFSALHQPSDFTPALPSSSSAKANASSLAANNATAENAAMALNESKQQIDVFIRQGLFQTAGLPAPMQQFMGRPAPFIHVRGSGAYQLAVARNAALRTPEKSADVEAEVASAS